MHFGRINGSVMAAILLYRARELQSSLSSPGKQYAADAAAMALRLAHVVEKRVGWRCGRGALVEGEQCEGHTQTRKGLCLFVDLFSVPHAQQCGLSSRIVGSTALNCTTGSCYRFHFFGGGQLLLRFAHRGCHDNGRPEGGEQRNVQLQL